MSESHQEDISLPKKIYPVKLETDMLYHMNDFFRSNVFWISDHVPLKEGVPKLISIKIFANPMMIVWVILEI